MGQHYEPIQPSFEDDDVVNQRKWEAWVEQESKKRYIPISTSAVFVSRIADGKS